MGCGSCGTGGCGTTQSPKGCKNNGTCGTGGCNKMNSFDWLSNMSLPSFQRFDIVEVKFKGGRTEFFRNEHHIDLYTGDPVVVDVQGGHHIGYVSLQGEIVRLQMKKKKVADDDKLRTIYRKANEKDLEKWEEVKQREIPTMFRARQIIKELGLDMKLSDVEYQADNSKGTFFYSAEERVDFRQLIKLLASEFKIRVEMRQISLRQEAGRIGGIGSCGRELCCSTWLTDFKSVSTSAARYQNLSLNPAKLSGQCGRLKCCLNYELDTYLDALIDIPKIEKGLRTTKGEARLEKVDIFGKMMWFSFEGEPNWFAVPANLATEMLDDLKKGKEIDAARITTANAEVDVVNDAPEFESQIEQPKRSKKSKGRNNKNRKGGGNPNREQRSNKPQNGPNPSKEKEGRPENRRPQRKPKKPGNQLSEQPVKHQKNQDKPQNQSPKENNKGDNPRRKNRNRKFGNRKNDPKNPPNQKKD